MILYSTLIYLTIPHYVSKGIITFEGILGETVTKNIELKNPTKKTI